MVSVMFLLIGETYHEELLHLSAGIRTKSDFFLYFSTYSNIFYNE